jgi:hypothetical protein
LYDIASIKKTGHLDTKNNWDERMKLIRNTSVASVEIFMQEMLSDDKAAWGRSILPIPVQSGARFSWEKSEEAWSNESLEKLQRAINLEQQSLFDTEEAKDYFETLRKLPYTFRLTFKDMTGREYTFPILDWEIAQLFFKMKVQYKSDEQALEKVRFKIEDQIFKGSNEVFIILGNIHHRFKKRDSLAVDGFIYPKRRQQLSLFEDADA